MTDPRDIEQPEPRRADSRGPQVAELYKNRPRAQREDVREDSRWLPLSERPRSWLVGPEFDGVPVPVEAASTAPLSIIEALEVESAVEIADAHVASEWDRMSRPPRSERRG